jgi:hypothetical protein
LATTKSITHQAELVEAYLRLGTTAEITDAIQNFETNAVVDMSGRLVLQDNTFGKDAVLLSCLENGCYLLILENTQGQRTQHKVVLIP